LTIEIAYFKKWLRNAHKLPRGPKQGTTGYQKADRSLFIDISKSIADGKRSAYGAALILADEGKIRGAGTQESKAKRVSALYRREHTG
jgi:hypothetical protein